MLGDGVDEAKEPGREDLLYSEQVVTCAQASQGRISLEA